MQSKRAKALSLPFLLAFLLSAAALPASNLRPERLEFSEVWAYLLAGEERFLDPALPISDLGYFGAGLSSFGKLVGVPKRESLKGFPGRVHLVVAEVGNHALTHFCLDPAYPLRDALVADIVAAAEPFDGVQIDFEAVSQADYDNFFAFLGLLKRGLGAKTLSVALPARVSEKSDYFGYERIGRLADRVVVMAYDEHWSTSAPGPVASLEWCGKVAAYALGKVPPERLVMGAPFYGRAWADKALSRAYKYSSLSELLAEKRIEDVRREGGIPFVEYVEAVTVRLFFDDAASLHSRLSMYRKAEVRSVAFWRLGQEDPVVWASIAAAPSGAAPTGATTPGAAPSGTADGGLAGIQAFAEAGPATRLYELRTAPPL